MENDLRITESSLNDTKEKLYDIIEKYTIERIEYDDLKEKYQVDIEHLKQQIKELKEEIIAQKRKISSNLEDSNEMNIAIKIQNKIKRFNQTIKESFQETDNVIKQKNGDKNISNNELIKKIFNLSDKSKNDIEKVNTQRDALNLLSALFDDLNATISMVPVNN